MNLTAKKHSFFSRALSDVYKWGKMAMNLKTSVSSHDQQLSCQFVGTGKPLCLECKGRPNIVC